MRRALVAMAVLLAACTAATVDEPSEEVGVETTTRITTTTTTTPDPPDAPPVEATTTTAPAADADLGSRGKPIPSGDPAVVGDYEIMVIGYTPNATAEVLAENQFNEEPPRGSVYTLIRLSWTYIGDESGTPWVDMSWSGIGDSNVGSDSGDCSTYPDNTFDLAELFPGGTTESNICLTVTEDDVNSLLLILEDIFDFDGARVFFALS